MRKILFLILLSVIFNADINAQESRFCVSVIPTPVLNTNDFNSVFGGYDGKSVKLDESGIIREMELIALPGTVFEIDTIFNYGDHFILEVRTNDYPSENSKLYIDSRFVKFYSERPDERKQIIPSQDEIIKTLNSLEGYPYMWGGNFADGIPQLLEFYKPNGVINDYTEGLWSLKGVDCSGLIYQASNGCIPRNTSAMVNFGTGILIESLSEVQIAELLRPLDLIVWSGHVVIVLDSTTVIESIPESGVKKSNLVSRLSSIMVQRTPVNDWNSTHGKRFVVRRWYNGD
ncbi:MAG: hypothetical protein OZ913_01070 [Ignavibacteriaceae bacterium]|nr:hypothetical protein [Ignavibacteriaceae bacterium]